MKASSKLDFEQSFQELPEKHRKTILPTAPLPEPISQNIEAIIALHARHEKDVPKHQKLVEVVTSFFGRPSFLYSILLVIILWITPNILPRRFGLLRFDPPPFSWLQFSLTIGSLLMTTGVLIKQNRQEKLAEQRAQLSLQLNLLSEQKIAKLIALVEELRQDLPNVKDRYDPEAEMMKEAADPHAVIVALEETLTEELANLQQQE
ncbi:DUF1003 domain-containing protein [Aetokthonos hydrillicola Thurmond2011]|jgi:uncharacterized membrane protein|uniref:DUF1003 domain-containing protein n=1 Tax=Aetokthonos hydrillicola Thurmond2011 TaxID=2712845 RepID=A0AAP5IDZ0_9CYAN|nr:DUF1003 domain-containing protein [Aetokthonos hydrillicola]MBO3460739.1 DUF1003 domain-containing protein [Aetokthonos hydrillicola CCALA 1050]MBW4586402.1 DUF1003 domain-containing protein [Aetokthonos hydrillicola CCALA 1050]MDR9899891.1 DUF1003 domain-containing protein [Aetokthonos hydrillicola Thurmond2011]